MKGKAYLFLHLAALIVAASATYLVFSTPQERESAKGEMVLEVKPSDLQLLAFAAEKKQVEVKPRRGGGFTLTITQQLQKPALAKKAVEEEKKGEEKKGAEKKEEKTTQDPASSEGKEPAPMITETKVTSYRASQGFDKTLERLLPLMAERVISEQEPLKLEKYGLGEIDRTLTVQTKAQKVVYDVGDKVYGGATTYLRQRPDGPIVLISSSLLRSMDIRQPNRYLERRLVGFEKKEPEAIVVHKLQKSRTLLRQGEGRKATWVAADSPDTPNAMYGNWVNTLFRVSAEKYLDDQELPALDMQAKIQFNQRGELLDAVELGSSTSDEGKKDFYARSQHTGQWVKVRRTDAESVVSDLPALLEQD